MLTPLPGNAPGSTPHDHSPTPSWRAGAFDGLLSVAVAAARAGHAVFPLWPRSKVPALPLWPQIASCDPDIVHHLWYQARAEHHARAIPLRPGPCNVGLACERSNLFVIDLDVARDDDHDPRWPHARHGRDVLATLAARAGAAYPGDTYRVRTPSGGEHLYFRPRPNVTIAQLPTTVGSLGWLIDTRGYGGAAVAPGSITDDGVYTIISRTRIATLPDWICTALTPPPPPDPPRSSVHVCPPLNHACSDVDEFVRRQADRVRDAAYRRRRNTLNSAAYRLGGAVGHGSLRESDAYKALWDAAVRHIGVRGFTEGEARVTITNGLRDGARRAQPRHHPSAR